MQKQILENIYSRHHEKKGRYGYLYCHGARVPFLRKWVGQGKQVLDLGCRDGMLTSSFVDGNDVTGVDVDQKALQLANRRLGIKTMWLDLNQEWPWEKGAVDVIVACEIVEHLFFLDQFMQKVSETLRPGGLFIGSVPNAFRMKNRLKFLFGNAYETDPTHVRQFSCSSLAKTLQEHFKNVEIVPIEGKILPFLKVSLSTPRQLNRLFGRDLLWRSSTADFKRVL